MSSFLSPEEQEYIKFLSRYNSLEHDLLNEVNRLKDLEKHLDKFEIKFVNKLAKRYREIDRLDSFLSKFKKEPPKSNPSKKYSDDKIESEEIKHHKLLEDANEQFLDMYFVDSNKNKRDIKAIYREIVKEIHPDRSRNDSDEKIRTDVLCKINVAFSEKNIPQMVALYNSWKSDPNSIQENEDIGKKLIKIIRLIYSKKIELKTVQDKIGSILKSDLFEFKIQVDRFRKRGIDIMSEMASELDKEIAAKKKIVNFFRKIEELNS